MASPRALLLVAGVTALAATACGTARQGAGTSTLPTLPPSSLPMTLAPITVSTVPTTPPPLTAPRGTAAAVVVPTTRGVPQAASTAPPAATSTSFPSRSVGNYVDEPPAGPLQVGFHGARVQALQTQLRSLGYGLDTDGYFGRGTEAAVRAFQQAQGIRPDGIAGLDTLARLDRLAAGR